MGRSGTGKPRNGRSEPPSRASGKKISAREHLFVCGFQRAHGERDRALHQERPSGVEFAAMWVVVLQSGTKWGSLPAS